MAVNVIKNKTTLIGIVGVCLSFLFAWSSYDLSVDAWASRISQRTSEGAFPQSLVLLYSAAALLLGLTLTGLLAYLARSTRDLAAVRLELTRVNNNLASALVRSMENEKFIRSLDDGIPALIAYITSDLLYKYANNQYLVWLGRRGDDVIGHRLQDVLAGGGGVESALVHAAAALSGKRRRFEQEFVKPSGERIIANVEYVPDMDEHGTVLGFFSLASDITELKQAKAHLHQALKQAEADSRFKSEFLANVSHEIRTPMNAIIGFTRILRRMIEQPELLDRLAKIDHAAQHLLGIINDILDMSKIEAGKVTINAGPFQLGRLLSGVMIQTSSLVEGKELDLRVEMSPDVPDRLVGDSLRLTQCILNYVGNAVKFTRTGTIVVRVALEQARVDGLLIRFEVEDNGIGIAPEDLQRLFSKFEQASHLTAQQFGGTGLGLAITRQLAILMGGQSGADSAPGRGSRFWFTALLQPDVGNDDALAGDGIASIGSLMRDGAGVRVLVVEDVALNCEILQDMLQSVGLGADIAENGEIAVAKAQATPYDIILMDVRMPVMDGLAATRAIRGLPGYSAVPIVALTANAFDEDKRDCLAAGMNDVLTKPIEPELLYVALAKWLGRTGPQSDTPPVPAPASLPVPASFPVLPSDPVGKLQACLGHIPGIDMTKGAGFKNRPDRYIRYLLEFAAENADFVPRLRACLDGGDLTVALRLLHSLKGTAGLVGMVGIHALAAELEGTVKDDPTNPAIAAAIDELQSEMDEVCTAVAALDDGASR